ncbi:MAG: Rrf2 family transcriptional regulator [Dehalococcoidales bacterium]|nr:Rrf2 family transcriptional regulator [Dehalococcoidales bacterium]
MKVSTKGRYGLRALLDLALHQDEGLVPLKDIARRQEFSLPYLEHLVAPLIAAGLVKSTRGARGGVLLLKPPSEVKLSEVVEILEGSIALVDCVNNPALCHRAGSCVTRDIWIEMKRAMSRVLDSTTLQDLVERQEKRRQTETGMYYI